MTLAGQVALVTGASRGIGRAIALELGSKGAKVAVNYAGSKEKALEVVKEIEEMGSTAIAIQADVTSQEAIDEMFKIIEEN